ncbi:MAG: hypothetical protein AAGJ35_13660, partial [Myxococcota bacterium]
MFQQSSYPPNGQPEFEYPSDDTYQHHAAYQQTHFPRIPRQRLHFSQWVWLVIGIVLLFWLVLNVLSPCVVTTASSVTPVLPVHMDQTVVETTVSRQIEETIPLVYADQDGELKRVLADAEAYSAFVRVHTENLDQAKLRLQQQATAQLSKGLETVFQSMQDRIDRFADWYFAYGTGYQLL